MIRQFPLLITLLIRKFMLKENNVLSVPSIKWLSVNWLTRSLMMKAHQLLQLRLEVVVVWSNLKFRWASRLPKPKMKRICFLCLWSTSFIALCFVFFNNFEQFLLCYFLFIPWYGFLFLLSFITILIFNKCVCLIDKYVFIHLNIMLSIYRYN